MMPRAQWMLSRLPEAAGGTGHAYWRMYVTSDHGGGHLELREFRFLDASDVDLSIGGSALSSGYQYGLVASNAFDKNTASGWYSPNTMPEWIGYNHPEAIAPAKVRFYTGTGAGAIPQNFAIEYSDDGTNWTEYGTYTNAINTTSAWIEITL